MNEPFTIVVYFTRIENSITPATDNQTSLSQLIKYSKHIRLDSKKKILKAHIKRIAPASHLNNDIITGIKLTKNITSLQQVHGLMKAYLAKDVIVATQNDLNITVASPEGFKRIKLEPNTQILQVEVGKCEEAVQFDFADDAELITVIYNIIVASVCQQQVSKSCERVVFPPGKLVCTPCLACNRKRKQRFREDIVAKTLDDIDKDIHSISSEFRDHVQNQLDRREKGHNEPYSKRY